MFRKVYKTLSLFYLLNIIRYGKIKYIKYKGEFRDYEDYQDRKKAIL
ncbi:unnamed protein product [marine sediment metagenome]|uniref:Uncharacterized protein n=1 Tax=marine sediment metagenome TaxID=412755 RepID=X1QR77_9ZZZZ